MKDMPTLLPDGLAIGALLPRADARDAFVAALRPRGAAVRRRRRHLEPAPRGPVAPPPARPPVVEFRGNVQTRLAKLRDGVAYATFLAMAGLHRLGLDVPCPVAIDPAEMLPAIAQGAIGIEPRAGEDARQRAARPGPPPPDRPSADPERAFLAGLDGSCQTPIAGLAELHGDRLRLSGEILRPDGWERLVHAVEGPIADAAPLGAEARRCSAAAGEGFFTA